jgi:hypothetical protein
MSSERERERETGNLIFYGTSTEREGRGGSELCRVTHVERERERGKRDIKII